MWWPGLIKQGAVPFLAAGVMIAGVMTAIANKSAEPTATSTVSSSVGVEATSAMWLAAEKFARGPIVLTRLLKLSVTTGSGSKQTRFRRLSATSPANW